ncbi:helix-turn-helix domain-containing protein [Chryseobacterium sp. HR92]|uniref:helix-turn-helix domain-containing protein n=1 Tax=Chryseobacterium sp. HR92 TaxID=3094839 RepID=UPI00388FCF43|nr:helix-turn-helix domain-containing protein [Chryseobacterium sp. HR92]
MDRKEQKINQPYYKKIYTDIINNKFPEKTDTCENILSKNKLDVLDIILLNKLIFGHQEICSGNQRLRSYDEKTIVKMLEYQKKNKLNNSQLALHFKLSRNTITKWKRNFKI